MEKDQNDSKQFGGRGTPRLWSGLILIIAGGLLFAYKLGAPIPGWIFSWPVLLITIGLIMGLKNKFHNPGALIMIVIGGIFLIDQINSTLNFHNYLVPAILVSVGLIYILRPKSNWHNRASKKWFDKNYYYEPPANAPPSNEIKTEPFNAANDEGEYLEINAVLGGVKKLVLSKNFKGGEITAFMGGAEINLSKADIQQPVVLEVNNIFGGTKLVVPGNWDIKNEVTAVFGGIEDKRSINNVSPEASKTMTIKGTCLFGGIEVSNY
jgi:predicted membrane protein